MAIGSTVWYIFSEEEDDFVAVDLQNINGDDDEQQRDLSSWELIDESDEEDLCKQKDAESDDDEDLREEKDADLDFIGTSPPDVLLECFSERINGKDVMNAMMESPPSDVTPVYLAEGIVCHHQFPAVGGDVIEDRYGGGEYYYEEEEGGVKEEGEDDEDEVDDYDLDDELIPYYVNDKFGRQRMRKLGKRSCPKLIKSKRLNYNYSRRGCFQGKHGLGLKHSLI